MYTNLINKPLSNNTLKEVILLDDFFQDEETINEFKQNRKLFYTPPKVDGLYVHVRLGDIDDFTDRKCTYQYYQEAIENSGKDSGFISSDSPNSELVNNLVDNFNLTKINHDPEQTIIFASSMSHRVLSLGTFSWWIGFLGEQGNVICPDPSKYRIWHGPIFEQMNWKMI